MTANAPGRVHSWRLLLSSFAVIAVLFAATNLVTWQRGRRLRVEIEAAMRDSLTSAELVARIGRDLQSERQLLDTHILEHERSGMTVLEARLSELQRDFAAASRAYAPLADQAEEARVWEELQSEVATAEPIVASVLEVSRQNRDEDARRELRRLDDRFAHIDVDAARLSELNRMGATLAVARLDAGLSALNLLLGALALVGIGLTAIVAAGAVRLVHRNEMQLTRYSTMLETQNHELDAFAGRVAHDLRGPLTSMRMAVWRLTNGTADGAEAAVDSFKRSIARMESLIGDLLALSRVEEQARAGICDPAAAVGLVGHELTPRLQSLTGSLRVDVAPARVRCGEGLLVEALTNLTDNAVKYRRADAPPEISIIGRDLGRRYELRVADNGIGMSPDESRQAFAPFYRARHDSSASGTGLGLSIVKRIAEAHGGDISVESTLGRGTTFVIHLVVER